MRIDLKKFLFAGLNSQKNQFFRAAQEAGIIHFIKMEGSLYKEIPHDVQLIGQAIKVLLTLPPLQQEELEDYRFADGLASKINELKFEIEKLKEDLRILKLEKERVRPFGNFSKEEVDKLEKEAQIKFQFFYAKEGFSRSPELDENLIFVGSDHNLDYFLAINEEEKNYDKMVEMKIEEPFGALIKKEHFIRKTIKEKKVLLNTYAKYNTYLHKALVNKLNEYHLQAANASVQMEMNEELYFTEGFVAEDKIEKMKELAASSNVYVEEIALEKDEVVPTYLENEGMGRVGEDLVDIYDTPSSTDKDPSLWVLLAFAIFFSMIIGDAGYGLVFLAAALYIRYKSGLLTGMKKRVWNLVVMLSCGCILWGTMAHSFFGIEMSSNSTFHKISLLNYFAEKKADYYLHEKGQTYEAWAKEYPKIADAKSGEDILKNGVKLVNGKEKEEIAHKLTDGIMLELALLVGIIHVSLGFLRYIRRNYAGIGWILFMWGCYLYFPSYLKTISMSNYLLGISVATAAQVGLILIYAGLGIAFFFSVLKHKLFGLLEMMNVIQVFGDILSYLRIYALGLAGAIVMATINDFALSMNIVFGSLLFVIGHLTNMALGIMGGVIHGLRLNFIEWYHYSFEGGGKKFNPLRKQSTNNE